MSSAETIAGEEAGARVGSRPALPAADHRGRVWDPSQGSHPNWLRRWMRPPRRFRLTREGKWFIGATLLLGMAAVNGGINLLFLLFGMLLCLLLANGVMSEACLRGLQVTRRLPASAHAGSPFLVGIAVRNDKGRIPSFSIEVEDLVDGKPVDRRCFYLKIPAGRAQDTAYRRTLQRRGLHRLSGMRVSTRFPFGLLRRSLEVDRPAEFLVFPALVPVPETLLESEAAQLGEQQSSARSRSGEFHSLREFHVGDDPRDIHWRTTAHRGRPFVRLREEDRARRVQLVLDDACPAERLVDGEPWPPFEAAVSMAASAALALLKRGYRVGLTTGSAVIAPSVGNAHANAILRCLALVKPRAGDAGVGFPTHAQGAAVLQVLQGARGPRLLALSPRGRRLA